MTLSRVKCQKKVSSRFSFQSDGIQFISLLHAIQWTHCRLLIKSRCLPGSMRPGKTRKKNWRSFILLIDNFTILVSHTGTSELSAFGSRFSSGLHSCELTICESVFKLNCFSVVCSYGLIVSQMLKWYGLGSIFFYIFALRANGGVEKLEMAVFQALHNSNKK